MVSSLGCSVVSGPVAWSREAPSGKVEFRLRAGSNPSLSSVAPNLAFISNTTVLVVVVAHSVTI